MPFILLNNFMDNLTNNEMIEEMIKIGLGWGTRKAFLHPKMRKYLLTYKDDLGIINLNESLKEWEKTFTYLEDLISQNKTILFVATQPAAREIVEDYGKKLNFPYVNVRWLGGTLTNFETFKKRLKSLKDLEEKIKNEEFSKYTKKEQLLMLKELDKTREKFNGLLSLENLPDALFIFCAKRHRNAIHEAQKMNIPIIGILGLEDNPDGFKYFIPLNDNTKRGIEFIFFQIEKLYQKLQANQLANNQNNQEKDQNKQEDVSANN